MGTTYEKLFYQSSNSHSHGVPVEEIKLNCMLFVRLS